MGFDGVDEEFELGAIGDSLGVSCGKRKRVCGEVGRETEYDEGDCSNDFLGGICCYFVYIRAAEVVEK